MPVSVFAGQAEVGQQYVTKGGWPVTVLEMGTRCVVRNDFTGDRCKLFLDQLLWPYNAKLISKEAIAMSKTAKAGKAPKEKKVRGMDRGARKVADGIELFRIVGLVEHQALYHDGIITVKGKNYDNLKEVATIIKGKEISGSGRSFFGLRSEPNITLGKEVIKGLRAAQDKEKAEASEKAKAEKPKKVRKVKAKKADEDDDDEDGKAPASVGAAVAKVFGKGRK